jgi:uncharacterized protein (TIGR00299 family) protein
MDKINNVFNDSQLPSTVIEKSLAVFQLIADAEGHVHDMPQSKVHFHEVGAVDTIIDIVGTIMGLEKLGIDTITSTPIIVGNGIIECQHGIVPLPSPATAEILKGLPIRQFTIPNCEMTTPTGAALAKFLISDYTLPENSTIQCVGYGAGDKKIDNHMNALRGFIYEHNKKTGIQSGNGIAYPINDQCLEITTAIDDGNPEIIGSILNLLDDPDIHDIYFRSIQMKKGRSGIELVLLANEHCRDRLCDYLFKHTPSLGVRVNRTSRIILDRETVSINYEGAEIVVKIGKHNGKIMNIAPEFDSANKYSQESGIPLHTLYPRIIVAAEKQLLVQ